MSSVLVTGGFGFIGSWVTRSLVEQGIKTVVYQRSSDFKLVSDIAGKIEYVYGDISDLPNLIHTIKYYGVERIIHMAAIMPDQADANPFMGFRINAEGALNVFEAARLTGIKRVVYTSSAGVYDITRGEHAHPNYKPIDEEYPKVPESVYDAAKLFGENMALNYNRIYGLDCVILRFGSTYGPGKLARHGTLAIVSSIIESAMCGRPLKIPQGRDQKNDLVYTRDLGKGIVLACFAEKLEHRVFHLATGKGETLTHLVEILNEALGQEVPIQIGPGLNYFGLATPRYFIYNIERARRELEYHPQYDLERGVRDYIETMRRLDIKPLGQ